MKLFLLPAQRFFIPARIRRQHILLPRKVAVQDFKYLIAVSVEMPSVHTVTLTFPVDRFYYSIGSGITQCLPAGRNVRQSTERRFLIMKKPGIFLLSALSAALLPSIYSASKNNNEPEIIYCISFSVVVK
jgi:hypothetical protein